MPALAARIPLAAYSSLAVIGEPSALAATVRATAPGPWNGSDETGAGGGAGGVGAGAGAGAGPGDGLGAGGAGGVGAGAAMDVGPRSNWLACASTAVTKRGCVLTTDTLRNCSIVPVLKSLACRLNIVLGGFAATTSGSRSASTRMLTCADQAPGDAAVNAAAEPLGSVTAALPVSAPLCTRTMYAVEPPFWKYWLTAYDRVLSTHKPP